MATVFTKIIHGEIPGRFVWSVEQVVGFLSINPFGPGHTLVVPREEIDQWTDVPTGLFEHAISVARTIGSVAGARPGGSVNETGHVEGLL